MVFLTYYHPGDIHCGVQQFYKSYGYQDIQKVEIGNKEDCKLLANDIKSYGVDIKVTGHLK